MRGLIVCATALPLLMGCGEERDLSGELSLVYETALRMCIDTAKEYAQDANAARALEAGGCLRFSNDEYLEVQKRNAWYNAPAIPSTKP